MDEHITTLSQDVADLKAWRKVTEPVLREIREDTKQILANQTAFTTRLAMQQVCPHPGKCIELAAQMKEQEERIASIESTRTEGMGAWKAAGIVAGFVGGLVVVAGGIIGIYEFFKK